MQTNPMIDSTPRQSHPTDRLPAESAYLYREGYETGYARGREAGYRQGYGAGFTERARRDQAASDPPATAEAKVATIRQPGRRLLGLPCENCGTYFYSDESQCPRCFPSNAASERPGGVIEDSPRCANSPSGARVAPETITTEPRRSGRLLGLPCQNCGTYFYSDEPQCPHCKVPNSRVGKTA